MSFIFNHVTPDKQRTIQLTTPYYIFMFDCFQRIKEELTWAENASISSGADLGSSVDLMANLDDTARRTSIVNESSTHEERFKDVSVDSHSPTSAALPQESPTPPLTDHSLSPKTTEVADQTPRDSERRPVLENMDQQAA
jgi:hypothetical protein